MPALWIAAVFVGFGIAFNYPSLLALTVNRASDSDRAWAVSSFTMFFEVGSVAGGLLIGAFAEVVGKQAGFLGGVVFCLLGLYLLRFRLVPAGSPDAGPSTRRPRRPTCPSPATDVRRSRRRVRFPPVGRRFDPA